MEEVKFGVNLWWMVPGFNAPAEKVQALLEKYGFDKEDIKEPSDRVEVSRAVRSFQNRRTKDERRLAEIAKTHVDKVVYGILDREQGEDEVNFTQSTTIVYDKNHNTVQVSGSLANEVSARLELMKDQINDADIRYFLRKVVKMCHGVSKRPTGGIYFVPAMFVGIIDQAQGFLAELGVGAKLYVERVMDGKQEREIVKEAVEDDLDKQLEAVMSGVDRIERRIGALHNSTAKVEELRGLMLVYQDLLGKEAKYEEMTEKLDKAVQVISAKMVSLQGTAMIQGTVTEDFGTAVVEVLKGFVGSLSMPEIVDQVKALGFTGEVPANLGGYFNYRVSTGSLVRVSRGQYALPVAAQQV
jgi:hypothetical protein